MKCQEGLIYDKNLLSCAIPGEDWECVNASDEDNDGLEDENNVYGINNLDVLQDEPDTEDDDFLEVVGETLIPPFQSRVDTSFPEELGSGDGEYSVTTQSSPTVRMITTQLQRLTQLMQHIQDKTDGVVSDDDVTADDLNSFLATQKIQSDSPEYQKIEFHSNDKTPMPSNGRIHPEIMSNIINKQTQLNSKKNQLTTMSMDATTQKAPQTRPTYYFKADPITEIKMKSNQNLDGLASHQIVVNRPEGSVLFNVPSSPSQPNHNSSPYLSEDILKTILEISKQMVTQNHQKQNPQVPYAPQPFYYGVPIPILSPQSNVQSFYNRDYQNNLTEVAKPVINKKTRPNNIQIISSPKPTDKSENVLSGYYNNDNYGFYQQNPKAQPYANNPLNTMKNYQNPNYYYQNYPSYTNTYGGAYQAPQQQQQQQQQHQQQHFNSPFSNYQFPSKNQFTSQNLYNQQPHYNHFDGGAYYENSPLVMESSAPSYVEQQPYRKESFMSSLSSYDENGGGYEGDNESFYDDVENDEDESPKPEKENLICSFVVQRQANKTDCFRYYVCNAKTKEALTYACPIFTAFNDQTKYCDALSYPDCKKMKDVEKSDNQNRKIYNEAHKTLAAVKKESQKVERIASMVKKESQKIRRNQYEKNYQQQQQQQYEQVPTYEPPQSLYQPIKKYQQSLRRQQPSSELPKSPKKATKKKKKRVKCNETGNIVDPETRSSYWHCFKGTDGRMKRINRKCTSNFIFCSKTRFCTPQSSC